MVGYDYPGFGLSEGQRGAIHNSENFIDEGVEFLSKLASYYDEIYPKNMLPYVALGYSQGGAACLGI